MYKYIIPGRPVPAVRMTNQGKWSPRARRYLTYKEEIAWLVKAKGWEGFPADARLEIVVRVYIKGGNIGDWDNFGKTASDGLQYSGLVPDDRQIKKGTVEIITCSDERMEIEIGRLANA